MNRNAPECAVALLLLVAALSGCATRPRAEKETAKSGGRLAHKEAVERSDEFSNDAMEHRVKALAHFAAGISAELNEEENTALEHYLKSAAADPGHEVLVIELARRFLQSRQPDKAIDLLTRVTASPQATGKMFAWLGRAYIEAGKTDQAIKANAAAIKKSPELLMAYRNLMELYQQDRQPKEAMRVLDEAAAHSSSNAEFWVDLAGLYTLYNQLHPDEAETTKPKIIAALDRAAGLKPQDISLIQKLADGYRSMGEFAKAEGHYLELLERFPSLPGLRDKLADIYLRTDRKDKAAEQLEALSRDNPSNEQAYYFLGNIAYQERRLSDAVDYFERALMLKPEFEPVYYRLAELKLGLNKPLDALELLNKARSRFRKSYALEFLTAAAYAGSKDYAEAVKHYTEAEVIAKASEPASLTHLFYFRFGSALERRGDYAEAEKYFRQCLELSPNFAEAMNYLGYMWAERGQNLDEAKKLIEKAVALEPDNAAYLDSLGWVLFKQHQPQEALDWLQKAVQQADQPDPTLYDHLGDIYAELKAFEKAREAWRRSVQLEPNDEVKKKLETTPVGTRPTE
jgi:tetratricopeptide (TPR) repeat protein